MARRDGCRGLSHFHLVAVFPGAGNPVEDTFHHHSFAFRFDGSRRRDDAVLGFDLDVGRFEVFHESEPGEDFCLEGGVVNHLPGFGREVLGCLHGLVVCFLGGFACGVEGSLTGDGGVAGFLAHFVFRHLAADGEHDSECQQEVPHAS